MDAKHYTPVIHFYAAYHDAIRDEHIVIVMVLESVNAPQETA